jgi:PKD repeat protein
LPVSLPGRLDEAAGRSGLLRAWALVLVALLLLAAGAREGLCAAAFSGSPTSGMAPLTVLFVNLSSTGWCFEWSFGDGGYSDSSFPYVQHTYTQAGVYTVSLLAMDSIYGCDTATRTNYITVTAPPPPVARFSGHPTSGTAPLTVTFTDSSTNSPTAWWWTFGDGGVSTSRNPSHTYTAVGTYTVALTATNAGGFNTMTRTNYISALVPPAPPQPAFTERVSVDREGAQGNGESWWAALSADGRYAAFDSAATNLVAGDTNGCLDVFVRDRLTGETERVSVASDGTQSNGDSGSPAISADGRCLAFVSDATNLVSGDTNGYRDVFVHDRETGETTRVSLSSSGAQGNNWSGWPVAISGDGRCVAWVAAASNLVSGDTNGWEDVFVRDRQTGQTERVSVGPGGAQSNALSYSPAISWDGRHVAFVSCATNLVAGDTNARPDVFVRDRQTGKTERVSVASGGSQANDCSLYAYGSFYMTPGISADGRYVAFWSLATNLVPGDTNGFVDVFVHDRETGATERASVSNEGAQSNGMSCSPAISADGRYVAFTSEATNLAPGDANGRDDIFVHDRQTGATERASVSSEGIQGNDDSFYPIALSADGRHVGFPSYASNLVTGDTNGLVDAFVRDRVEESGFYAWPSARGKAPFLVGFADLSAHTPTGPATAWDWDFGDGSGSTEQNPIHEYTSPGAYTVSLTATCEEGQLVTNKERYITASFRDVAIVPVDPADHWALKHILACVKGAIVGGYPDGTYRPTQAVDRGQMAVYTARGLVSPNGDAAIPDPEPPPSFSDVGDHWAYKWIEYAVSQNVVQGYPDDTYRPGQLVDRGQMAVYVSRAMVAPSGDAGVPEGPPEATFPDVPISHWAYRWVEFAVDQEVVGGYPDGTYRPAVIVTRDQMAVYVQRAFYLPM